MLHIKMALYQACLKYLDDRIASFKVEIDDIQEAANNETKSTAGDKYETAREMMQQDINLKSSQLLEMQRSRSVLERIDPAVKSETVVPGTLVITNLGSYYIAISLGKVIVEGDIYYAISAESPIGKLLMGKTPGDEIAFNNKLYRIKQMQ